MSPDARPIAAGDIVTHARKPGRWVVLTITHADRAGRPLRVMLAHELTGLRLGTWAGDCRTVPNPITAKCDPTQGDMFSPTLTTL